MVRLDPPLFWGTAPARFLVAYNDDTAAIVDDPACWRFSGGASLDGWARLEQVGGAWARQSQLPVSWSLQIAGVHARHGDPWLASWSSQFPGIGNIVAFVSVAQGGGARFGPPWFFLLTRSMDGGSTFEESKIILGPQEIVPDGPKVAIPGTGRIAVVVWNDATSGGIPFEVITNLDRPLFLFGGMTARPPLAIVPTAIAAPPDPSCTFLGARFHPRVAAGLLNAYVAAVVDYGCASGVATRLEVYRSSVWDLEWGAASFARILSAAPPPSVGSGFGALATENASSSPPFGTSSDRGSSLPSLAVGRDASGEFVIVADLVVRPGTLAGEGDVERIVQWRLPTADSCNPGPRPNDLATCGVAASQNEVDALASPTRLASVADRTGTWESKPAVFSGKVPDGRTDARVGMLWYSQPYKGLLNATDEMRTRTIVEAVISSDGGRTYQGPFLLTAPRPGDPGIVDQNIGLFFYPCPMNCSSYFGEYLSGAFQSADPARLEIIGAWGDSREGCSAQAAMTQHQHVWAGVGGR